MDFSPQWERAPFRKKTPSKLGVEIDPNSSWQDSVAANLASTEIQTLEPATRPAVEALHLHRGNSSAVLRLPIGRGVVIGRGERTCYDCRLPTRIRIMSPASTVVGADDVGRAGELEANRRVEH